jgi:hypothetical protein
MGDVKAFLCHGCGRSLSGTEKRGSGPTYCETCVKAPALHCHTCQVALKKEDFAQGKAVTLLGRRFCESCLRAEVLKGRQQAASAPAAPAVQDDTVSMRRLYGRYMPHHEAQLVVKAGGLAGLFGRNRVRVWLDVSEGGFRAIIAGVWKMDARLDGSIAFGPTRAVFPFHGTVKQVRPSDSHPDATLVACRFEEPSRELQTFILGKMSGHPAVKRA